MTKARKPPTCQRCRMTEAEWAMQYVASEEPSFTTLGYAVLVILFVAVVLTALLWEVL